MRILHIIISVVLTVGMPVLLMWLTCLVNNSPTISKAVMGFLFTFGGCSISCLLATISTILPNNPFLVEPIIGLAYKHYISIGLCEELYKFIILISILILSKPINIQRNAIVYAVAVSLGFSFIENIYYILNNSSWLMLISRTFICVPMHWTYGICMGYVFGKVTLLRGKYDCQWLLLLHIFSVLAPMMLHGTHNFLIEIDIKSWISFIYDFVIVMGGALILIKFGVINSRNKDS